MCRFYRQNIAKLFEQISMFMFLSSGLLKFAKRQIQFNSYLFLCQGHNSVLKTFKKSNINVYDLLKHIENIDEFLNKKVIRQTSFGKNPISAVSITLRFFHLF